jgi:hypothetical protein
MVTQVGVPDTWPVSDGGVAYSLLAKDKCGFSYVGGQANTYSTILTKYDAPTNPRHRSKHATRLKG